MSKKLFLVTVSAAILGIASSPLAQNSSNEPASSGTADEQDFGVIVRQSKWQQSEIPVCWENPNGDNGAYRLIVRRATEETWGKHSALSFTGWSACTEESDGIRIKVEDSGPHVKAVGRYLDAMPNGMVLNFKFRNWSPTCQSKSEFCVYAVAVHEFGHAIGFTHEQNRDDAPQECRDEAQGTNGDFKVTKYDPFSIMNYCNAAWNGDGRLSKLDIYSVETIYGRPQ